ncbi:hypothetical protein [Thauera butanivorans]|uniref:hypothetical protein n=1 Tax=Thauera butanivorans TaxID=86174 RepID=UPI00083816C7|nr:hypothetical protein [Thauera butanivorans]
MIIPMLMLLIFVTSLVALYFTLCAVTHMGRCTRGRIRWAYIAKAGGQFVLLASVADYLLGDPYAWPWLMLVGVALSNAGTAGIHMLNRRQCKCPECPVRQLAAAER